VTKTSAPKTSVGKSIVSVKVTLLGTKPPVWRRLLMLDTMTLADLHGAIQALRLHLRFRRQLGTCDFGTIDCPIRVVTFICGLHLNSTLRILYRVAERFHESFAEGGWNFHVIPVVPGH
jgi:hypothetical protein